MRAILLLTLLVVSAAVGTDIRVDGDVALTLLVARGQQFRARSPSRGAPAGPAGAHVTAAPELECPYQYPEQKQIDDILSNMMNMLTRVFVKVHVLLTDDLRRRGTRFLVVNQKHTSFFDHIFENMTAEYQKIQNKIRSRADEAVSRKEPCANQAEIKQMWRELLDNALTTFRRAAAACILEHLRSLAPGRKARLRERLGRFLLKEVAKVRVSHLGLLCDNFQLCYNELL